MSSSVNISGSGGSAREIDPFELWLRGVVGTTIINYSGYISGDGTVLSISGPGSASAVRSISVSIVLGSNVYSDSNSIFGSWVNASQRNHTVTPSNTTVSLPLRYNMYSSGFGSASVTVNSFTLPDNTVITASNRYEGM